VQIVAVLKQAELVFCGEDYQALVHQRQIELLRRQPGLAGVSPWVLEGFCSPMRLDQGASKLQRPQEAAG
jgi:hypothetical protein